MRSINRSYTSVPLVVLETNLTNTTTLSLPSQSSSNVLFPSMKFSDKTSFVFVVVLRELHTNNLNQIELKNSKESSMPSFCKFHEMKKSEMRFRYQNIDYEIIKIIKYG